MIIHNIIVVQWLLIKTLSAVISLSLWCKSVLKSVDFRTLVSQMCIRRSPAAAGAVVNGSSAVTAAAV